MKVGEDETNMGARMVMTAQMANRLRTLIVDGRCSPYDARDILVREFRGRRLPCLRTICIDKCFLMVAVELIGSISRRAVS